MTAGTQAIARCDALGAPPFSLHDDRLFRPFLSAAHLAARATIAGWMREAGLETRVDAVGNLIGRRTGPSGSRTLLIGSHIDSVENAGRYDGALGVMIGIACAAALVGRDLPFALEVIAFGDEEGSRFPVSMMCSRAITRPLERAFLDLADRDGVTVREALRQAGHDPDAVPQAARTAGDILAYVEPHIEQGPVLEALALPVGIVTGIAGQLRLVARFTGIAGHAGTTPMHLRRDAMAAAAEAILAVERICGAGGADLVGTVGRVVPSTGAFNVIAGDVELGIDIRAAVDADRDAAARALRREIADIAHRRGVAVTIETAQTLAASPSDPELVAMLEAAVVAAGATPHRLVSGAGHDAMTVAAIAPTAMLFIRCAGGISHNPAEHATASDADTAIRTLIAFVERLGSQHA